MGIYPRILILYSYFGQSNFIHRYRNIEPLPQILFCRELRFAAIYALFLRYLGKKSAFWGKNSASWARSALLHGIYCIFY